MTHPTKTALVTDGLWRKSVSVIRSLGKAGYRVIVMGDSRLTTGFWSRYTWRRVLAPTASKDPVAFGEALLAQVREHPGLVVCPMEDASLLWMSEHEDTVREAGATFLLPPRASLLIAEDKGQTMAVAEGEGLRCPRTWQPSSIDELKVVLAERLGESYVVKPREGTGSAGLLYDPPLSTDWREHWDRFGALLVQERVPADGRGLGASFVIDGEGRCVAAFAHERIQQYPSSGGPSTDRVSLRNETLIADSLKLLKALKWTGVAMVEWKAHSEAGEPMLMEINPRFWGSLELGVRAGVDFPALYARAAEGDTLPEVVSSEYPEGVRCRWFFPGEILRYLSQDKNQREGLRAFMRGFPSATEEWDRRDLRGTLAAYVCQGGLALNPKYWKYARRG